MIQAGRGTTHNFFEAEKFYLKAAEKGHPQARMLLAFSSTFELIYEQDSRPGRNE